nr:hypothetical protein [Tanacetum cinerariifolium]
SVEKATTIAASLDVAHDSVPGAKKPWSVPLLKLGLRRAVDNGEQQIIATVDGKEFTITKASVRRHLQLADADGKIFPSVEIFDPYHPTLS